MTIGRRMCMQSMELISKSRLERARAKGADIIKRGPVAIAARYRGGMIFVELSSGVEVRFPVRLVQGLQNGNPKKLGGRPKKATVGV
jgi:hypothetical protein